MKLIDKTLLDNLAEDAKKSPRLRMNYNFHQSLDDKCHRFHHQQFCLEALQEIRIGHRREVMTEVANARDDFRAMMDDLCPEVRQGRRA